MGKNKNKNKTRRNAGVGKIYARSLWSAVTVQPKFFQVYTGVFALLCEVIQQTHKGAANGRIKELTRIASS